MLERRHTRLEQLLELLFETQDSVLGAQHEVSIFCSSERLCGNLLGKKDYKRDNAAAGFFVNAHASLSNS